MRFGQTLTFLFTLFFLSPLWAICVSATQANLRTEPSANGKVIWTVGKYMPLMALEQKGDWIQVRDLDGQKSWVHGGLVTDEFDCAVVKITKSTLRKGPGTQFAKTPLSIAHKYMPFKKVDRDGAWLHIEDDYGFKHWVYENNLWEPLAYTQLNY